MMQNFCDWFTGGAFSSTGECFDIGVTCQAALQKSVKDKSKHLVMEHLTSDQRGSSAITLSRHSKHYLTHTCITAHSEILPYERCETSILDQNSKQITTLTFCALTSNT